MRCNGTYVFLACFLALGTVLATAQAKPAATIEYSSGDDLIVIRQGRRVSFKDAIGLDLYQGDQVQTGKGVFVELSLSGRSAVVKLAENTTFILDRLSDGQTSLQLVYGRIRAKVEKLAGSESFTVRSVQAIAGVRGTDFGVDVVAPRSVSSTATTTSAYCFEGAVEVTAFVRTGLLAAESLEAIPRAFVIEAGEMVKVEGETGKSDAVKTAIDETIQAFWHANDYIFEGGAAVQEEIAKMASPAVGSAAGFDDGYKAGYNDGFSAAYASASPGASSVPDPDYVPEGFLSKEEARAIRSAALIQKGGIMAGVLIGAGGAALAVKGFILLQAGDMDGGTSQLRSAAIISITAIPFLVLSLFANP